MRKINNPDQEKENFLIELFTALNNSREITPQEIQSIVVDLMENPKKRYADPEIISVVSFIRKTLKDTSIPVDWLTGSNLSEMQKALGEKRELEEIREDMDNYNLSCDVLLQSGKLNLRMNKELPLNIDEMSILLPLIITKIFQVIAEKNGKLNVGEIRSFEIFIIDSEKHYYGNIVIELKTGDTIVENLHLCPLIDIARTEAERK